MAEGEAVAPDTGREAGGDDEEAPLWVVVHTGPQRERMASRELRRQGYVTFAPFQRLRRRRKLRGGRHRVETVELPQYPRYIFAAITAPAQSVFAINATLGVTRVVHVEGKPLTLAHGIMDRLMAAADRAGEADIDLVGTLDRVARVPLPAGTRVRFSDDSPFAGHEARVTHDSGREIRVRFAVLGASEITVSPGMIGDVLGGETKIG